MNDDWSGGGFGSYRGLNMIQIRDRFAHCVSQPSWQSISAVLRIAREQIESRGRLGVRRTLIALCFLTGLLGAVSSHWVPGELVEAFLVGSGIAVLLGLMMAFGLWKIRVELRINLVQEAEIRREALAAVSSILETGVAAQPLTREQRDLLREMVHKERFRGPAANLVR